MAGKVVVRDRVVQTVDMDAHWKQWRALTQKVGEFAKTLE